MELLTEEQVERWVSKLIAEGRLEEFYSSPYWRKLRREVLDEYKMNARTAKLKDFILKQIQYIIINM